MMLVNLPFVNSEVKEIIDVLNHIECQSDNDINNEVAKNLRSKFDNVTTKNTNSNVTNEDNDIDDEVAKNLRSKFDNVTTENTNPNVIDENEVANIFLNINDIASDAVNFPNPNDKKEYTLYEFHKITLDYNSSIRKKFAGIVSFIIFYVLFYTIYKRR